MPQGRRVGQPGHEKARLFLEARLAEIGLTPFHARGYRLPYRLPHPRTRKAQDFTNLVGVVPGRKRKLPPILLGAHYDSVIDAPCADDNATSVALNLAIAEEFVNRPLDRDLIIALFDAEEPPHFMGKTMGSIRFHQDHCKGLEFAAVIVSDLIGHDLNLADIGINLPGSKLLMPHLHETVFITGAESDPVFPAIVEETARETKGIRVFPTLNRYIGSPSDHYAFEQEGHPFLFLSCAQGRYYHDERDTLDWINFKKLARITEFVAGLIEKIDDNPAKRTRKKSDPFEFEIRMIRKTVGPALPLILRSFGESMPENREDLDQLIGMLV